VSGDPIGALRERVTLQSPLLAPDGAGGADVTWENEAMLWAKVEALAGDERLNGERLAPRARFRLTIRHRQGLTTQMRALWKARPLDIRAIRDPDGRKQFLILDCEEAA
jgi:SPP1 family predicted phage head-tail adaptor